MIAWQLEAHRLADRERQHRMRAHMQELVGCPQATVEEFSEE